MYAMNLALPNTGTPSTSFKRVVVRVKILKTETTLDRYWICKHEWGIPGTTRADSDPATNILLRLRQPFLARSHSRLTHAGVACTDSFANWLRPLNFKQKVKIASDFIKRST